MTRTSTRVLLLVLLLLAFGLRAYRLDYQELRGDEAFGYFFSLRTYDEIVSATVDLQEPHPVASYFVQKAWMVATGNGEFALRYLTVWFSVLAVALIYRLGRRLGLTAAAGLAATTLMTISPYIVWHAQDARMYSMSLALTLASTWLAVEWLECADRRRRWLWSLAYIAVSWLALHTHYFAAFVLVAQYLYAVGWTLWSRRWRTLVEWLLPQGAVFLLYLPWLIRASETLASYRGNGDSPGFAGMIQRSLAVFAGGESVIQQQGTGLALLALFLLVLGTWRLLRYGPTTRRAAVLLWLYLSVPLLATWISSLQRPVFNERYLVAAAPPFYLLIASVFQSTEVEESRRQFFRYTAAVLFLLFLIGALLSLNRHYHDPIYSKTRGWRELAAVIERYSGGMPADRVRIAQNFPDPTLWYYYDGTVDHVVLPPSPHDSDGAAHAVALMVENGVQRVILPRQPAAQWDNTDIALSALAKAFTPLHEAQIGVWPVQVFDRTDDELPPIDVKFENGTEVTGFSIAPRRLYPGGLLSVQLHWRGESDNLTGDEKVTVQLIGPDGQVVAQRDRSLRPDQISAPSTVPDVYGILLPATLTEGEYRLIIALYLPVEDGPQRIPTMNGEDAATVWQTRH